ncbi:hypothetical protein [Spiroplasma endosymbiont of Agriotes lineatus]|uniref:Y-family DNA polymerase n=1 Tax=Spiroplasma endosymbiont of Agriotes lineatus TaxID=3077930 RepID=UPI003BAE3815
MSLQLTNYEAGGENIILKNRPASLYIKQKRYVRCPTLICINNNRKLYIDIEYSHKIFNLLVNNFTNKVEITSIDEYCLDATNIYLQYNKYIWMR